MGSRLLFTRSSLRAMEASGLPNPGGFAEFKMVK
jgi:hypothetical protein